jgi:hypothetical protein
MAGERIADLITTAAEQRDNVQQLDAVIPLLGRRLLYEGPSQEDEIAGYSFIRGLAAHPDEEVQHTVSRVLEQRWKRIGFYHHYNPSKRYSFGRNERPHYMEGGIVSSGSGVGDDEKIAILELAHRREPMTTRQFEDAMRPLIGIQKDFPRLVDELKRLHVLTDEAQYVSVVESVQARVRMTEAAYGVLAPHLPVLEAISYPEQKMAEEEKQLALAVGKEVDRILSKAVAFWTDKNIQGLTMPQEPHFGLTMINVLDMELKEQKRGGQKRELRNDEISFVAEQGRLYKLSHANNPLSDFHKESVEVKIYQYQRDENQLLINFWGHQVGASYGRELGWLGVYKGPRITNSVEVSDILMLALPEGLQDANRARVSAEGMTISWRDVSHKGKEIDLDVHFQKSQDEPILRRFGRGETYITAQPTHITIPTSSESKRPRRRNKTRKEDSGLDYSFRGSRTTNKEIVLDKDTDSLEVMHPKGRYIVAYQKAEGGIEITFTGKGWENKIVIPSQINPVEVVRSFGQQLEGITQKVSDEREAIQQQVSGIKHMGLVEHTYYNHFGRLPDDTEAISDFFDDKEYYNRLVAIDEGLSALDPDTQYYAKYYMAVLGDMRNSKPIQERTAWEMDEDVKDPRQEFRRVIRKYDINIPEELLMVVEEVFMPEEYRNPSNTDQSQ